MNLISNLFLGAGTALFIKGIIYQKNESYFVNLFNEIEKCQEFDFDYVQKLEDLPVGKTIALCAQIDNDDKSLKPAIFDPQKKVCFSSVVSQSEGDKIWKIQDKILEFKVRNMLGATIDVKSKESEIFLYNLKKIESYDCFHAKASTIRTSMMQKMRASLGKKTFFTEYGLIPESHMVFIGKLKKDFHGNLRIEPKVISGENRSLFLKGLDDQIVEINRKGKRIFYAFFLIVALETLRKIAYKYQKNKQKLK